MAHQEAVMGVAEEDNSDKLAATAVGVVVEAVGVMTNIIKDPVPVRARAVMDIREATQEADTAINRTRALNKNQLYLCQDFHKAQMSSLSTTYSAHREISQ